MWFTRKSLLKILSDTSVHSLEKDKILEKKLKKVIKETDDLKRRRYYSLFI